MNGLILLGKVWALNLGNCFCKRFFFLLLATGSDLEKIAAIVNPENKPTQVNWTLMAQCLGNLWKNSSLRRV